MESYMLRVELFKITKKKNILEIEKISILKIFDLFNLYKTLNMFYKL